MTEQEALKYMKLFRDEWDVNSKTKNAMALDVAIKSLEKQIPKKVIYKPKDAIYQRPFCPCCGEELFDDNYRINRCECGQALIYCG